MTFTAGYDITAARQFVVKRRCFQPSGGYGLALGHDVMYSNASETGATRDSRERPALFSMTTPTARGTVRELAYGN